MKKLNNKGMTAVEILVCFILVVVITVSMFTTVSTYKNKQQIESFKQEIYTYKNLLAKDINDDLIKIGLVDAKITENINTAYGVSYAVDLYLKDGTVKCLKVESKKAYDYLWDESLESQFPAAKDQNDSFMISYGNRGGETKFPIPDLGESKNPNGKIIKDLRINDVSMEIVDGVLSIYIGFYHPDLGTRYSINIVCPINFDIASGAEKPGEPESVPEERITMDDLVNKSNPPGTRYDDPDAKQEEMFEFEHPATDQTGPSTDYRYVGDKPNNYIWYNNEYWRIIGVVDGTKVGAGVINSKIKIVRDETLGDMKWDNASKEWKDSTLAAYLNSGEFWNNLTPLAKSQIVPNTYYLGAINSGAGLHANDYYSFERTKSPINGRALNWTGNVGLFYPSDYIYTFGGGADDFCFNDPYNCNVSEGKNPGKSWLYRAAFAQWTINNCINTYIYAFRINSNGRVYDQINEYYASGVRPVVYLKPGTELTGIGSRGNPYKIVS